MRLNIQSLEIDKTRDGLLRYMEIAGPSCSAYGSGGAGQKGRESIITFELDLIKAPEVFYKKFKVSIVSLSQNYSFFGVIV